MPTYASDEGTPFPAELDAALSEHGIASRDEVSLRRELERRVPGYNLFRLTPAAAQRWKCRYRLLLDAGYYDGQSAAEAYGRALLAVIAAQESAGARDAGAP